MALAIACAASFGALAAAPAASARPDSGASFEWGCAADGDCSAGGFYEDGVSKNGEAFVIGESGKVWGQAQGLPSLVTLNTGDNAIIGTVSCAAAGNCGAGGYYRANGSVRPFVVAESGSAWDGATPVPGTGTDDAQVLTESCPVPQRCSIGGYLTDETGNNIGFIDDQPPSRVWPAALTVQGTLGSSAPPDSVAKVMSISCKSPGDCAAGGFYTNGAGDIEAFTETEKNGAWQVAKEVAGSLNKGGEAEITGVSCGSPGDCAAVGYYAPGTGQVRPFTVTSANGSWGPAAAVNGIGTLDTGHGSELNAVSCGSAGNCTAGGSYSRTSDNSEQPFVVTETSGSWGAAREVPGIERWNTGKNANLTAVSCVSPGNCSVAGQYKTVDQTQVWVASQHNGGWGVAGTVTGLLNLNTAGASDVTGLSCATVGSCGMVGYYFASADSQLPFVASGSIAVPTATALALSATKVTYGHERAEKLSVTVTAVNGEPVTGTVKVKAGSKVVCSVTLSAGHGSCKPAASALKPGTYSLVAQYGPTQEFEGSPSPAKALTVVK
jgi:hypothetical protein